MLPAVTAAPVVTPPPVMIATAIPGNSVLRVPVAAVAPNVSNVPVGDNASKGGNTSSRNAAPVSGSVSSGFSTLITFLDGTPSSLSLNASTTFMAQLMSQDSSPYARSVMSEYEKLVALSQVKYKPSNASLPEPEPSSVFSQILKQELKTRAAAPAPAAQTAANASAQAAISTMAVKAQAVAARNDDGVQEISAAAPEENSEEVSVPATPAPRPSIAAYLIAMSRNNETVKPAAQSA